jgi:hypothetical protein
VECHISDTLFVGSLVVLDQSLSADVPNVDGHVFRATSDTSAIRMELDRVDCLLMVIESANLVLCAEIPKLDKFVFRSRSDESGIRTELS